MKKSCEFLSSVFRSEKFVPLPSDGQSETTNILWKKVKGSWGDKWKAITLSKVLLFRWFKLGHSFFNLDFGSERRILEKEKIHLKYYQEDIFKTASLRWCSPDVSDHLLPLSIARRQWTESMIRTLMDLVWLDKVKPTTNPKWRMMQNFFCKPI